MTRERIPRQVGRVKTKRIAPEKYPCPLCGVPGRRREIVETWTRDIAYRETAWVRSVLGVYDAACDCVSFFQAENPEAPHHWEYTVAVREAIVNGIVRDNLSVQKLLVRLREDFLLDISEGFVYLCLAWADARFDVDEHFRRVAKEFSGVICVDELYDGDFKVIFATDPQNDCTVGFRLVEAATREQVEPFLRELKARGIEPRAVITDDSSLYPEMLQAVWPGVDHQTCIFHFMKNVGQAVVRAVRKVAQKVPGAPKRRRGRPRKRGRPRHKDSPRKLVTQHRHLIVKKDEKLTPPDREALDGLLRLHPHLGLLRDFTQHIHSLFEPGITQRQAKYRRTRLLKHPVLSLYPHQLRSIVTHLEDPAFGKLISFLARPDGQRTSNHVERTNRGYRQIQKARYSHRTKATIEQAIRLDIARRQGPLRKVIHFHAQKIAAQTGPADEPMAA